MQLRHVACVILWIVAVPGLAGESVQVTSGPGSWQEEELPAPGQVDDFPPVVAGDSILCYRNSHSNYYDPPAFFGLLGQTYADDIHMTRAGRLRTFRFIFGNPGPGSMRATVWFYANPDDASIGPLVAGPFEIGPVGGPGLRINYTVSDPPPVTKDLWFTIRYHSNSPGILLANGAWVGTSHDLFYNVTLEQTAQLSGICTGPPIPVCVANMYLEVYLESDILPIEATTWSAVKALFHVPPASIPKPTSPHRPASIPGP